MALYAVPLAMFFAVYTYTRRQEQTRSITAINEAIEAGLTEPPTLHPVIDPAKCMGCGSCVTACPEGEIIGLVNKKAILLEPAECIGHGACKAACPFDAISLVFGTATRGVDLPVVAPDFQTNVPGLYIAGELGGMGLIRNAIEQGRQALASIAQRKPSKVVDMLDVFIVGAGPAGMSASLAAKEKGLNAVTVEQEDLGGTVAHFPRGKLVMTQPATLPLIGKMTFREISKEALLEFWHNAVRQAGLKIQFGERVEGITPLGPDAGFEIKTTVRTYRSNTVLLTIGRRGTPRKLGVPGEEQSKVVYRMIDPAQYTGQHVVVVGGGDSAIEAANALADEPGTTVTLSYRSGAFARCKPKNRAKIDENAKSGRVKVVLNSVVKNITQSDVELVQKLDDGPRKITLRNDAVIVCAGGILPSDFLRKIGINVETKHGTH
ncbi:MAG: NAD(P)-binding domain-containing protein [Hyphomicrobiaceae bacterium]|nr:NAD(P)-binding domain-containing protein [Hyphomicrobiaceae bacterium]